MSERDIEDLEKKLPWGFTIVYKTTRGNIHTRIFNPKASRTLNECHCAVENKLEELRKGNNDNFCPNNDTAGT